MGTDLGYATKCARVKLINNTSNIVWILQIQKSEFYTQSALNQRVI